MNRSYLRSLSLAALCASMAYAQPSAGQETFATPKLAISAVVAACKKDDTAGLLKIFGPEGKDVVISGDPSDDKDGRALFAKAADEKYKLIPDPMNKDKVILSIGKTDWPFPIPLIHSGNGWFFDSAEGRQEIVARRIGSNEMSAIEVCRAYVEAQFEYAQSHRKNGAAVYARKIVSSPGQDDGLYWEPAPGRAQCQVPKGFADAAAGMSMEKKEPYLGYYFRILEEQGPSASGGALHYVVNDEMIGGFALVAWPAEYGVSGVQTFIVDHDGIVYEKHLGPETVRIASEMTVYDPDPSWQRVQSK